MALLQAFKHLQQTQAIESLLLAIGDGALGFWTALRETFPAAPEARSWVHKIADVLDKLPKLLQPKAKELLHGDYDMIDFKTFEAVDLENLCIDHSFRFCQGSANFLCVR